MSMLLTFKGLGIKHANDNYKALKCKVKLHLGPVCCSFMKNEKNEKVCLNWSSGFLTRSNTNRTVQPQKMARGLKFRKKRDCTICVAKTKALISCAVTAQLICDFVFAYAKSHFSHEVAHIYQYSVQEKLFIKESSNKSPLNHIFGVII